MLIGPKLLIATRVISTTGGYVFIVVCLSRGGERIPWSCHWPCPKSCPWSCLEGVPPNFVTGPIPSDVLNPVLEGTPRQDGGIPLTGQECPPPPGQATMWVVTPLAVREKDFLVFVYFYLIYWNYTYIFCVFLLYIGHVTRNRIYIFIHTYLLTYVMCTDNWLFLFNSFKQWRILSG